MTVQQATEQLKAMTLEFKTSDDLRDSKFSTPDDIIRFDDLSYGSDREQVLDVYRPKNAAGKLPTILSVHGGGWFYGDKERYQFYCMALAQHGFAVVNFSYRLTPRFQFPAQAEDVNNVFQWVLDHCEQYDLDTDNLFAVGDSAGANLLAVYAQLLTNADYAATYPFPIAPARLRAVALNCGIYDLRKHGDPAENPSFVTLFPNGGNEAELTWMSPNFHMTKDFPPTFLMSARGDFLVNQVPILRTALEAHSVPVEEHIYGSEEDPLFHVFHCSLDLPAAQECNDDTCRFFHSFLQVKS